MKKRQLRRDRGAVLVLVALLSFALVGLLALSVGLGMVAASDARLQNVANMAALSSLQAFVRSEQETLEDRIQEATARGDQTITENSIFGMPASSFMLENGTITFGHWLRSSEQIGEMEPCSEYPCFRARELDPDRHPNAVKIRLRNPVGAGAKTYFGGIFGVDRLDIEAEAVATVISTCVGMLLDVSWSSVDNTFPPAQFNPSFPVGASHRSYFQPENEPDEPVTGRYWQIPKESAAFALPKYDIYNLNNTLKDCRNPASYVLDNGQMNINLMYWCSLFKWFPQSHYTMATAMQVPAASIDPALIPQSVLDNYGMTREQFNPHHVNVPHDYTEQASPFGPVLVANRRLTTRRAPSPLRFYMDGFNAGLRELKRFSSGADRAFFLGFAGKVAIESVDAEGNPIVVPRRFPPPDADERMTRNLDPMIQLTNIRNLAPESISHANILDMGIFPLYRQDDTRHSNATNIAGALDLAIAELKASCDPHDRKVLILATDGISTCAENTVGEGDRVQVQTVEGDGLAPWCDDQTNFSYGITATLLGSYILPKLQRNQIALSVIIGSRTVAPNIRNVYRPEANLSECASSSAVDGCFLTYDEMLSLGFGAAIGSDFFGRWLCEGATSSDYQNTSIADCSFSAPAGDVNPEDTNWYDQQLYLGRPGVQFSHPVGMMSHMAALSGGRFCPLMYIDSGERYKYVDHDNDEPAESKCDPDANPGATPCKLQNRYYRSHHNYRPLEYLSYSQQAAKCVTESLVKDPFLLVAE